eukprot:jgi/Orpsp1_1/1174337/evm.model.c7180000049734.1
MKNKNGETLLITAIKKGYNKIAIYLIENRADINVGNIEGDTPIILSFYKKDISMIKHFYENGADISIKNDENKSFLTILKECQDEEMKNNIKEILSEPRKDGQTALTYVCKIGKVEEIQNLIDLNIDINVKNQDGDSPLTIICKNKNINNDEKFKFIKQMIKNEEELNIKDKYGLSLEEIAYYFHNEKLENFLKELHDQKEKVPIKNIKKNKNNNEIQNTNNLQASKKSLSNEKSNEISENSKEKFIDGAKFNNILNYSICKIEYKFKDKDGIKTGLGTGFFIKLLISSKEDSKYIYGLMTNNHVIGLENLKNEHFKFKIIRENIESEFTIKLNEKDFSFTSPLIDITFIQFSEYLIEKEGLNKEDFLCMCNNDSEIDKEKIKVIQYPGGGKLKFADGKIIKEKGFDLIHESPTKKGSSGSPLINGNLDVIGVHKSKREKENINIEIYKNDNNEYRNKCETNNEDDSGYYDEDDDDEDDDDEDDDDEDDDDEDDDDEDDDDEDDDDDDEIGDKYEDLQENYVQSDENNNEGDNLKVATKYSIIAYAIKILYKNKLLIGTDKAKDKPKKLSKEEIKELNNHGLKKIKKNSKLFKFNSLLFCRTNHAWYWCKPEPSQKIDKNNCNKIKILRTLEWSIITLKNINEDDSNYNNLNPKEKDIITFLKLTDLHYLTGYKE